MQSRHRCGVAEQGRLGGSPIPQGRKGVRLQMGRAGQLLIKIGNEQAREVVAPGSGVRQVRSQRRVEHEALRRQRLYQGRPHQILYIVAHLADVGREQSREQGVPVAAVAVGVQLRRQAGVPFRLTLHYQGRQVSQAVHRDSFRLPP